MGSPTKGAPVALLLIVVAASGCGNETDAPTHAHKHDAPSFGVAADESDADRQIEIAARDPYDFEPTELDVELGETITFVVTNEGGNDHEFVLGDRAYQESHGSSMDQAHDEPYAVSLEPGDTKKLTWTFVEEGEILFACHVERHYEEGMVGSITVSP